MRNQVDADSADQVLSEAGNNLVEPHLRALWTLWNERRGTRLMPATKDITPRDMKSFLDRIHLYDVVEAGKDFRVRVAGTAITTSFGYNPTGLLISAHPHPARGKRLAQVLRHVMATGKPVRVVTNQMLPEKRGKKQVEALWLPLGVDGVIQRILAGAILTTREL